MSVQLPPLFDAHFHVIDPRFRLVGNQGYLPEAFTVDDYRTRTAHLGVIGGAIVSGSFQGYDQDYLIDALGRMGPGFVGVTQLPATATDAEVLRLDRIGVRAVRFNLRRGGSDVLGHLDVLARRVHELAGWHTEVYADIGELADLVPVLATLPKVSVDHLGLSREGLPHLLKLVEGGARVKATGFGRCTVDVPAALRAIAHANPAALMVGTDLPSTRAPRPFEDSDLEIVLGSVGAELAPLVFSENAMDLYQPAPRGTGEGRFPRDDVEATPRPKRD